MSAITRVRFHGATLLAQRGDRPETTLVAMKPIVIGMGLDWSAQLRKIKRNPVLTKGMAVMATPSDGGDQEGIGLPLTRLNFWLATVSAHRVPDAKTRDRIILYQEEAADALFEHFFGQAMATVASPSKAELGRMVAAITKDALDEFLSPVHASFAELVEKVDAIAANRVADPAATPTKDYMTTLTYLEGKAWPSKGRRAVVNAVSARMMRHSERHGFPIRTTAERGVRLYHVDAWSSWEGSGGNAFLAALRDQREGQGLLRLDRSRKAGAR